MLLNQYGGLKGVQEITGLINLINPIGIISVIMFFSGVWLQFEEPWVGKFIGGVGAAGIVVSELYKFFTWHVKTITGEISLRHSLSFVFPEFYFGLAVSLAMTAVYFAVNRTAER